MFCKVTSVQQLTHKAPAVAVRRWAEVPVHTAAAAAAAAVAAAAGHRLQGGRPVHPERQISAWRFNRKNVALLFRHSVFCDYLF